MNYIERVLEVATSYDHDQMPIDVQKLRDCYARLREQLEGLEAVVGTLRAIAAPDTPCVEMQALAEAALNEVN